jgi:hypothetical protein
VETFHPFPTTLIFSYVSPVTYITPVSSDFPVTRDPISLLKAAACEMLQLPLGILPNFIEIDFVASRLIA